MSTAVERIGPGGMKVAAEARGEWCTPRLAGTMALALYDREARVAGMLHWMVPEPTTREVSLHRLAATTAIPDFLDAFREAGGETARAEVALAGGSGFLDGGPLELGPRNAAAAHRLLADAGIRITTEATGGQVRRVLRLDLVAGRIAIETLSSGVA